MASNRAHLLLFNPDQFRGDFTGYAGDPTDPTPNLDRLVAEEAVAFNRSFCQNPQCVPSRCCFHTGWYPHTRGHRSMYHTLHPEQGDPFLLDILRGQGYRICWSGKNDVIPGRGKDKDFDPFEGHVDEHLCFFDPPRLPEGRWEKLLERTPWLVPENPEWRGEPGDPSYYSFLVGKLVEAERTGDWQQLSLTNNDWFSVENALLQIEEYDGGAPLCLYLALSNPHVAYGITEPFFSAIDRRHCGDRVAGYGRNKAPILDLIRDVANLSELPEETWTEIRAVYRAMIRWVDHQFGRIVQALKDKGMWDDTAAFFFSDHGDYTGDYGLIEKNDNTFEDCLTRVPFVFKPPQGTPVQARVTEALVELTDLPATIYDLLGIDPGYDHFGRSLLPLAAGQTKTHRDAVFCEGGRLPGEIHATGAHAKGGLNPKSHYHPKDFAHRSEDPFVHDLAAMCRTERWKYIRRSATPDELYDLEQDPHELDNLLDAESRPRDPAAHAAILADLRERTLSWYQTTGAPLPRIQNSRV